MVPADRAVEGPQDLIVGDVVDELRHGGLLRVVKFEVLVEVGEVLGGGGAS